MKKYYAETNSESMVLITDGVKAVYIDETAFDEELTLEVAKAADYSNFDMDGTIEEANHNYADGTHLIDFNTDDYDSLIEF